MIDRLLDAVRAGPGQGDALRRRTERTGVTFESGRLKAAGLTEEAGVNVRVLANGRLGVAGTTAAEPSIAELVARARASADLGEEVDLAFPPPPPSPLPHVTTYFDAAANASLDELIRMGRLLVERLSREGCQINVSLEREAWETVVGNTAGARGAYASTAVVVGADLTRIAGDDVLLIGDLYVGADLPGEDELAALVRSIETRLEAALTIVAPPDGALPVIFTPSGSSAVLLPLEQALSGKTVLQGSSPLADQRDRQAFDARFSLTDDPLVPGRTASRPVDDECVPSVTLPLVERGVVRAFIYDLETAARAKTRSTGHGHRGVFGKPHGGYTNLIIGSPKGLPDGRRESGVGGQGLGGGLLDGIADGLLVDDLIGVGQGNVISGAFSHPVALAYRIERGEVTGRVKDAAVAGNAYELLKRIGGFGADARWLGSRYGPSVLLEGVSVARR